MQTRNILDSNGNVIGTLSLPDNTPDSTWQAMLQPYSAASVPVPSPSPILTPINLTATSSVTTSSSQPATLDGMTATPTKGSYVVLFSGSIATGGASAVGEFGIYVNGVLIPETRRDISCNLQLLGGLVTVSLNAIGVGTYSGTEVDLDGTQTIDVRFRSTNGGVIVFNERVLTLLKVK